MGNQHSGGLEFCSRGKLYTNRNVMNSVKSCTDTRVGYSISTKPLFQVPRIQEAHQQAVSQQQEQEIIKVKALPVSVCSNEESEVVEQKLATVNEKKSSSYNVYISCLDKGETVCSGLKWVSHSKSDLVSEMNAHFKDDFKVFEGVFGNVILNEKGLVLYTDITCKKHCEEYNRDEIIKIFPMGIAKGGLTKSIWFNDITSRDDCFELMSTLPPPSYNTVMADLSKYALPCKKEQEEDGDNLMKTFEGIYNMNVIVHADNVVLFSDISGNRYCEHYDRHNIKKCFPNGIRDGGLSKTIWFKDSTERDLCFMLMQWNKEVQSNVAENGSEKEDLDKEKLLREFIGLYGIVLLHSDSQIEFTSFLGERVKCFYEPTEIREVFPKGISYGSLPVTIWFRDIQTRDSCIAAMREM